MNSQTSRRTGGSEGSGSGKTLPTLSSLGEENEGTDSEDEEADILQSKLQQDTNKFEMLCDGVLSSLALVQASLADFLLLKDELLQHALPASLMARLTMVSGRVFRSTTDLHTPVTEMVRLVRVYSESWEAKSAALKKLHSDYDSKHKQLNIAIRRLQLADATQKRIAREKRIMNWEKLFAKLTSCRGHGRRWKFLIGSFKQKSKLGADHLQHYIDALDKRMDDEEEELERFQDNTSRSSAGEFKTISSLEDELDFDSEEEEDVDIGFMTAAGHQTRQTDMDGSDMTAPGEKRVKFKDLHTNDTSQHIPPNGSASAVTPLLKPVYIQVPAPKPPTTDKAAWTHEPQYNYHLNIKIYRPVGVDRKDLRCSINFKKQFKLSETFEKPSTPKGKIPPHRGLKGRTLMGSRAPTLAAGKKGSDTLELEAAEQNQDNERFKLVEIAIGDNPLFELPGPDDAPSTVPLDSQLPEDDLNVPENENFTGSVSDKLDEDAALTASSMSEKSQPSTANEESIKLGVHHGQVDEMVAWASISLADLRSLDIQVRESEDSQRLFPTTFPIYPIATSRKERSNAQSPCGYVKAAFYYTRTNKPYTVDKDTEAGNLNDLVLDLTGVDLTKIRKEDLAVNKTFKERCLSAMSVVSVESSEKPETVPRAEMDMLVEQHETEMLMLQHEYEHRLNQLAATVEALQNEQLQNLTTKPLNDNVKRVGSSLQGWTSTNGNKSGLKTPPTSRELGPIRRKGKRLQNMPEWGADLPRDFFDRMRLFEEEKATNREELAKKTKGEVEDKLLKQLAGQYRLRLEAGDAAGIEKDVCLPAVFMPSRTGSLYNPRAHHYFHPYGAMGQLRLTQPPSMFQLPPLLHNNHMAVINLFDIRHNFEQARRLASKSDAEIGDWDSGANTPMQSYSQPTTPQPTDLDQPLDSISEHQSVS